MKSIDPKLAIGLIVLAIVLLGVVVFRGVHAAGGGSNDMSGLTPPPRPNSPTFTNEEAGTVDGSRPGRGAPKVPPAPESTTDQNPGRN
jgi:hypothetical protein